MATADCRPAGACPGVTFASVAEAIDWWRRYTAVVALRAWVAEALTVLLECSTSEELDAIRRVFDKGRQWGIDPPDALPSALADAFELLECAKAPPSLGWGTPRMQGSGWRQCAQEVWRNWRRPDGWAIGPFNVGREWARTLIDGEISRRIGTLPAASAPARSNRRL
ncbi:hypothetical protein [Luteibacter aegosomatissinici]|uniref:hypothetical protein n=1 Tax=Luteibacter aegosomatissinici TaxID=2911539 RepID=UPI001FF7136B|nr:hypothetical protein [Luteibacter aegosomatissinici]UPG92818.1 hypothetical protein L2Y97_13180 [Luteibacter aegosomatissinici]